MPNPTLLQNKSKQHCFCFSIWQLQILPNIWILASFQNIKSQSYKAFNILSTHVYVGRVVSSCQKQSLCYFCGWHGHNCRIYRKYIGNEIYFSVSFFHGRSWITANVSNLLLDFTKEGNMREAFKVGTCRTTTRSCRDAWVQKFISPWNVKVEIRISATTQRRKSVSLEVLPLLQCISKSLDFWAQHCVLHFLLSWRGTRNTK